MLSGFYILDDGNDPVVADDPVAWSRWMEDRARRTIASDQLVVETDNVGVLTTFTGMDNNNTPPQLFETMVLGGALDGEVRRCSTWADAEQQHQAVLAEVKG